MPDNASEAIIHRGTVILLLHTSLLAQSFQLRRSPPLPASPAVVRHIVVISKKASAHLIGTRSHHISSETPWWWMPVRTQPAFPFASHHLPRVYDHLLPVAVASPNNCQDECRIRRGDARLSVGISHTVWNGEAMQVMQAPKKQRHIRRIILNYNAENFNLWLHAEHHWSAAPSSSAMKK